MVHGFKHTVFETFKSVSINEHHFNRYVKFINSRLERKLERGTITERHHIIPKSIMPEYESMTKHKWNIIVLSTREHIIAHIMLHFAFGKSMTAALFMILNQTEKTSTKRTPSIFHKSRFLASVRDAFIQSVTDVKFCYDSDGKFVGKFHKDHEIWKDDSYTNYTKTDARKEQLERLCAGGAKFNKGTSLYNNGEVAIKLHPGDPVPEGFVPGALGRPSAKGKESPNKKIIDEELLRSTLIKHNYVKGRTCTDLRISPQTLQKNLDLYNIDIESARKTTNSIISKDKMLHLIELGYNTKADLIRIFSIGEFELDKLICEYDINLNQYGGDITREQLLSAMECCDTRDELCTHFDVSPSVIHKLFTRYNIAFTQHNKQSNRISKEDLIKAMNELKSKSKTMSHFRISEFTLNRLIREYEIDWINKANSKYAPSTKIIISKQELLDALTTCETKSDLMKHFKLSRPTIMKLIAEHGI